MIEIRNISDRREAVWQINLFDEANGINPSQRAKYERPLWFYIAAILPSSEEPGLRVGTIRHKLQLQGIHIIDKSIRRTLRIMMNPDTSIDPARRNFGQSAWAVVQAMEGIIKQLEPQDNTCNIVETYKWKCNKEMVRFHRSAFRLTIRP